MARAMTMTCVPCGGRGYVPGEPTSTKLYGMPRACLDCDGSGKIKMKPKHKEKKKKLLLGDPTVVSRKTRVSVVGARKKECDFCFGLRRVQVHSLNGKRQGKRIERCPKCCKPARCSKCGALSSRQPPMRKRA